MNNQKNHIKAVSNEVETQSPRTFRNLSLSLIYPAFWGFYFSLSRYIRIGSTIDIYNYMYELYSIIDWIIVTLFLVPYLFVWLAIWLYLIRSLRITLWSYTENLFYYFHIKALQYYDYFRMSELLYKALFVYFDVISGNYGASIQDIRNCGFIRRTIAYMFYRPYILHLIIISSIFLELFLFQGKLYYGIYILFLYPFFLGIIHCLHQFGYSNFIRDVCLSDYIAWNFGNPRYYSKYWFYIRNATYWYEFEHTYPPNLLDVIRRTCVIEEIAYKNSTKFLDDAKNRSWGFKYVFDEKALKPGAKQSDYYSKKSTGLPRKWSIRVAAFYNSSHKGVRWFHSSPVLHNPLSKKIHPLTIHFIKTKPYSILALLNHPGQNFGFIQKLAKNISWPKPNALYTDTSKIVIEDNHKTIIEVLEINTIKRFQSLATNGVILGTYQAMKERYGHPSTDSMQMRPDVVSWWFHSNYTYKGYLGIDQKNKKVTTLGRNQVITNPVENYTEILDKFRQGLHKNFEISTEMDRALDLLKKTCNDPNTHLETWAQNLHLFPDKWKPPLLLNKTFDESHLNPEIVASLRQGDVEIKRISDELYTLNISEETGTLPEESLDLFEGSFLQEILRDETD